MREYKSVGYKRRHYEDIARLLGAVDSLEGFRAQIVNLFRNDNTRFDVDKFNARIAEWKDGKRL